MRLLGAFVKTRAALNHIKPIMAKLRFRRPFCLHRCNLRFAFMDPSFHPHDNQSLGSMLVLRMRLFGVFVQTAAVLDHIKPIKAKLRFWRPFCLHWCNLRFAFMDPSSRPHDNLYLVSMYVVRMHLFGQFVQMRAIKNPMKSKKGHF